MKTIRLDSESYQLTTTGAVEVFGIRDDAHGYDWFPTRYVVGAKAVLVSRTDVSPDAIRRGTRPQWHLHFDLDGIPGNSDRSIKRTSGWRGTTNDLSVDAHGIVTIRKIRELKNGDIAVTVS